jgi:copper(I)-binding protein
VIVGAVEEGDQMQTCQGSKLILVIVLAAVMVAACGAPAAPQIRAEDVWSRPAVAMGDAGESGESGSEMGQGMGGTGAVFMVLVNDGREVDRLVGAKTDVAKVVEIHETRMEGEVMKMQMLTDGLEVPAMREVQLKPGGYHVMLIGLQRNLEVGDRFAVELLFEKSESLLVEPVVRQP